ncbi:hypothetical protein [Novosphingobium huizhouense]|uniref:hypothetical protein n=1 Tax=Novosphingobium huizhouense TaxID=2866625 RepID=UPI001CD8BC58|nr:hypothetical protein [Novosphingobium huizhouense]
MALERFVWPRAIAIATALWGVLSALPAQAQIVADDEATLTAINNGNVVLNGSINNPEILSGSGNAISLVSQGAIVSYDPRQALAGGAGENGGTVTVSISNLKMNASNSGSVSSTGTINGEQSSATGTVTITATGLQSGLAINTKPKG